MSIAARNSPLHVTYTSGFDPRWITGVNNAQNPRNPKFHDIVELFDELVGPLHLATALATQPTQGGGNAAQDPLPQHPEWG